MPMDWKLFVQVLFLSSWTLRKLRKIDVQALVEIYVDLVREYPLTSSQAGEIRHVPSGGSKKTCFRFHIKTITLGRLKVLRLVTRNFDEERSCGDGKNPSSSRSGLVFDDFLRWDAGVCR